MRTSFELKIVATDLQEAKSIVRDQLSEFLDIDKDEVEERVSLEFKVSYPKAETVSEIEDTLASKVFQVTVFGSLKQSVVKPFGL
jgi:predicted nucleotidyltransferase component of viral defense system